MYSSVLTKIGAAQLMNSQIIGTTLKWSKMGVGDGGGHAVNPDANKTALVREKYRAGINHLYRDPQDPTQIVAELVMLPEEGGYTIREVGIYDTGDNLVVYGSLPEVVKPVLAEGSGVTLTIRCRAAIGNAANIKLIVDPTTVIATRGYVNDMLQAYFPLSGGIVTGNITYNGNSDFSIKRYTNTGRSIFRGGTDYNDGASLYLNGKNYSGGIGVSGMARIMASNGTKSSLLDLNPDGNLQLDGVNIATRKYVDDELDAHSAANDAHPLASVSRPGFMSAADKQAVDRSFRGIKVGNEILYPSGAHQYAELIPQSPVILTPNVADGKITVSVDASVTAKAGAIPLAGTSGLPSPTWGCLPPGWIGFFAVNSAPAGFLACDGANVSRSAYSRLFSVIGTRYGAGNGSTTFGIPDLRGKFLRGHLDGVTEAIGTPQSDAIRNITASFNIRQCPSSWANIVGYPKGAFYSLDGNWKSNLLQLSTEESLGQSIEFDASRVVPTSAENRPVNMALLPCIKY